ncbi:MAG: hypothetical protein E5Y01_16190 [Mesorhizobium sp.]|uniref:hypothetical protein n=1 Tax=Mesorhizobium sp. TaxID=1871066 RepID=UPI00120A7E75|nr:hypothetical protein [Mesorhizobium sp.]TJV51127.1 MAG: hypothetical protein E5Y01_16190 [Mesorhizobium sp.]
MNAFGKSLAVGLLIAAIAFIIFVLCGGLARAHDAPPTAKLPQGWSYPFACCANYDCHQATGEVSERPEGYVITQTGEVIAYGDKRIKPSPDGEFHWCAHQAGLDAGKTICLFVPDRGS